MAILPSRPVLIALIVGLLHSLTPPGAAATSVEYTVRGELRVNEISRGAALKGEFVVISTPWVYEFEVAVSHCAWRIHARPIAQPPPSDDFDLSAGGKVTPAGWDLVAASDGREFCEVRNGPRPTPESVYQIRRGPGGAPFGVTREVASLWYAYASHCELAGSRPYNLVPLEMLPYKNFAATTNRFGGDFELLSGPSGLPKRVVTSGYAMPNGMVHEAAFLEPREALTNAVLQVVSTTNVGAFTLPAMTRIHFYTVVKNGGRITSTPAYEIEIETRSVSQAVKLPAYPPELKGRFLVSDYRFMDTFGNGVVSQVTTDKWPDDL